MLKKILPRTLFGRSLLILIMPVILLQIVATFIFYDRHWDDVTRRLSLGLAGDISMVIRMLGEDPESDRQGEILALARRHLDMEIRWLPGEILPNEPVRFQLRNLILDRMLNRALGERLFRPVRTDTVNYGNQVEIRVQLPDGVLQVLTPRKRITSSTTIIFVMWMVATSLVLLAIAIVFLRNQMRPVRRLAEVADSFGKGGEATDLKPSGAAEVRQATRAFLRMRDRIRRQISQRTEMLAGVSHDLRTPLTRMKLQLALLGEGREVADLRSDVAEMEGMVEGYLAFARGQDSEAAVVTDLTQILNEVVAAASRNGRNVDLTVKGDMIVAVRPGALKRCLTNLLDNAQRFGEHVWVGAERNGESIEIVVDDDGPGIPEESRDEVLRPFRRLEASRNPETGGVGLGLAIAWDVARGHGGDLVLETAPPGGLRAVVRIPV